MPYTELCKNLMLDAAFRGTAPALQATHAGLLKKETGKSVTGVASTDTFTSTGHGFSNGDLVLLTGLTGGSGLVASVPYFVINSTANTFQLALHPGGSAVDFTSDLSSGTVSRLVELSGGSPAYARKAITYAAAAGGVSDDSTNGAVFDVPAGAQIDYSGYYSASTGGTLMALASQTQEVYGSQGTYTLTDVKHDLNS